MANCEANTTTGKTVIVEYFIGCTDKEPTSEQWKVLGGLRTKELTTTYDTEDTTADDSVGNVRESITTFRTVSFSGDGIMRRMGATADALKELYLHFCDPKTTGGQPTGWFRITDPHVTHTIPGIITEFSRSFPNDAAITFSLAISATASLAGVKVEETKALLDEKSGTKEAE